MRLPADARRSHRLALVPAESQTSARMGGPSPPGSVKNSGVAFGSTSASTPSSVHNARSSANQRVSAPFTRTTDGFSCRTRSRAFSFALGLTASSRSATMTSAVDVSAFSSFRSSKPRAKRSERAVRRSRTVPRYMSDIPDLSTVITLTGRVLSDITIELAPPSKVCRRA